MHLFVPMKKRKIPRCLYRDNTWDHLGCSSVFPQHCGSVEKLTSFCWSAEAMLAAGNGPAEFQGDGWLRLTSCLPSGLLNPLGVDSLWLCNSWNVLVQAPWTGAKIICLYVGCWLRHTCHFWSLCSLELKLMVPLSEGGFGHMASCTCRCLANAWRGLCRSFFGTPYNMNLIPCERELGQRISEGLFQDVFCEGMGRWETGNIYHLLICLCPPNFNTFFTHFHKVSFLNWQQKMACQSRF